MSVTSLNGHSARMAAGKQARGKAAIEKMLVEALDLLSEIASPNEWAKQPELAATWCERYEKLREATE